MHPEGRKSGSWNANEAHILRFLEMGIGNSSFDDEVRGYVRKMQSETFVLDLHSEPARGYAVVFNDTKQYLTQIGDHPLFACGGAAGLENESDGIAVA